MEIVQMRTCGTSVRYLYALKWLTVDGHCPAPGVHVKKDASLPLALAPISVSELSAVLEEDDSAGATSVDRKSPPSDVCSVNPVAGANARTVANASAGVAAFMHARLMKLRGSVRPNVPTSNGKSALVETAMRVAEWKGEASVRERGGY